MKTTESLGKKNTTEEHAHPTKDMKKNRLFNAVLIFVAFVLTCVFIVFGSYFGNGEDLYGIAVGYPSSVDIFAPRAVENPVATEQQRQHALAVAAALPATIEHNPEEWTVVKGILDQLAEDLGDIRAYHELEVAAFTQAESEAEAEYLEARQEFYVAMEEWEAVRDALLAQENGDEPPPQPVAPTPPEAIVPNFQAGALFDPLGVPFSDPQREFILAMDYYAYTNMWDVIFDVAYSVQATNIHDVDSIVTREALREYLGFWALYQDTRDIIEMVIALHLRVNMVEDDELTQQRRDAAASDYRPVWVMQGETVVRIGDIVTDEIYAILEQLGLLGDDAITGLAFPLVGALFIVALLFFSCGMYLAFYRPTMVTIRREAFLLFTLYMLVIALVWTLSDFTYPFLPILIFPMLVSVLIERRSAVVLSFAVTLISYFMVSWSWDFLFFFLISGFVIAMLSRFTTDRNKIFLVGSAVLVIQFGLSLSISVIMDVNQALYSIRDLINTAGIAGFNGLLVVIISTGSLPIWEAFFGVVTPIKLLDLTNPTNLLLRRLTIEAPGTYHHSLIVANLAETAAYDIGANAHAARVGGYYHDVGKLKYPQYFAENLDGDNPHDYLDPSDSARLIISHVYYGLTLATEHRLPQFVRDIIQEHHGNSMLQFFYHKAKEADPDVDEAEYRYPFEIPQTRESACVSLADSVEAAVRSMMAKAKAACDVENTIRSIIRNKLLDGQLADSQLSIRDLAIIEQSFVRVLKGMYHERIPYPKLVPVGDAESVISASLED